MAVTYHVDGPATDGPATEATPARPISPEFMTDLMKQWDNETLVLVHLMKEYKGLKITKKICNSKGHTKYRGPHGNRHTVQHQDLGNQSVSYNWTQQTILKPHPISPADLLDMVRGIKDSEWITEPRHQVITPNANSEDPVEGVTSTSMHIFKNIKKLQHKTICPRSSTLLQVPEVQSYIQLPPRKSSMWRPAQNQSPFGQKNCKLSNKTQVQQMQGIPL